LFFFFFFFFFCTNYLSEFHMEKSPVDTASLDAFLAQVDQVHDEVVRLKEGDVTPEEVPCE
jgi:hypothetical protein